MDDYSKCININNNIEHLDKKEKDLMLTLENLDIEINNLGTQNTDHLNVDKNLQNDYNHFEELEDQNKDLSQNKNSNKLEFIKRDYKSNRALIKGLNSLMIGSALLFLPVLIYSLINTRPSSLVFNVLLFMVFTY